MAESFEVVEVVSTDDEQIQAVQAVLDHCPTSFAQQTVPWCRVIAPIGPDEPLYLTCRNGGRIVGVLPTFTFHGPMGSILTTATQAGALGGVACCDKPHANTIYETLLAAFLRLAKRQKCAVATVITNPFWPDHELCRKFLKPDFLLENSCQVLDLNSAVDGQGRLTMATSHVRRHLRKAESGSLLVDEDQTEDNVLEWYEIHEARHREIGATPLPRAMFLGALHEMIPHDKGRFFFIRLAGAPEQMVAGGFYIYHGRVIDALMPSMRADYRHLSPNYLLAAHTIRWAKARGLDYYNWQASPPDGGVYRFKRQWGSRDATYFFHTCITDDVTRLLPSTVEAVRQAYPWHYVIPYDTIGTGPKNDAASSRKSAWGAMAGTQA